MDTPPHPQAPGKRKRRTIEPLPYVVFWAEPPDSRPGGSAALSVNGELRLEPRALQPEEGRAALVFDLKDAATALIPGCNEIGVEFDPRVGTPARYRVRVQEHHPDAPGRDPRPLTEDQFVTHTAAQTILLLTLPI